MKKLSTLALCLAVTALTGCDSDSTTSNSVTGSSGSSFSLRVLHINDHHSHLSDNGATLTLGGVDTDVRIGGFSRVVTKVNELRNLEGDSVALHAGDAITGDLYYTLFKGEADAAMMNQMCFDAFTLGNHEFDAGDVCLVEFLDYLNDGSCANDTPVLGANITPEVGVSPLALLSFLAHNRWARLSRFLLSTQQAIC